MTLEDFTHGQDASFRVPATQRQASKEHATHTTQESRQLAEITSWKVQVQLAARCASTCDVDISQAATTTRSTASNSDYGKYTEYVAILYLV